MKILKERGITLIALVITIIVLLILAGVTISIAMKTGIMNKAETAVDTYSEQQAREKLEVSLANMAMEKHINSAYNSDTYLTNELIKEGYVVSGDIVIVDGWQFTIDRSVPKIGISIGKGTVSTNINIQIADAQPSTDYVTASITATVTSDKEIRKVYLNGVELATTEYTISDGIITITKENITENMTISILAKDIEGNYNTNSKEIKCITEDMDIWNLADLKKFRTMVNEEGRTFEGRTVTLRANIDLNEGKCQVKNDGTIEFASDAEQWEPIGIELPDESDDNIRYSKIFKGTFKGENHTISNLYIKNNKDNQGFFGIVKGNIENLIITGSIEAQNFVGGICGTIYGANNISISNCINNAKVTALLCPAGIIGYIADSNNVNIIECSNNNNIYSKNINTAGIVATVHNSKNVKFQKCVNNLNDIKSENTSTGGIVGVAENNATIYLDECYNKGNIISGNYSTGGLVGMIYSAQTYITNCYNTGSLEAKKGTCRRNCWEYSFC